MGDRTLNNPTSSYVEAQSPKHDRSHPFSPTATKLKFPDKRLIVCCDGTWNASDVNGQPLTNVARIARCISDIDDWTPPAQMGVRERNYLQIVHYQPGVGNGTGWAANVWDGVTGRGLDKSIRAAYQFICLNWSSSADQIVLIGFSRGAFTVRCVAQFIQEVGLLTKSGVRHLPRLFELWKTREVEEDGKVAKLLKAKCEELRKWGELVDEKDEKVYIEACAVWDTVSAVAHIPLLSRPKYRTVGKTIPKNVRFAVQALALGERRAQFEPMVWDEPKDKTIQTLRQCWFAGNHSDVGGGNKDVTHSNITLAWMVGQLTDKIQFNQDNLWAITTTRSWSRPTPGDKIEEGAEGDLKHCRVVAESPISRSLLRSETSWLSFLMRIAGYQVRKPLHQNSQFHYSVYILRHLGIATYAKVFSAEAHSSTKSSDPKSSSEVEGPIPPPHSSAAPALSEVIRPIYEQNKFEGDILEKWAKHILCAHVNLKQARNADEVISKVQHAELYHQRLSGRLVESASYAADIPISAILSAFHRLSKNYEISDTQKPDLKGICDKLEYHPNNQRLNIFKQISPFRQEQTAEFKFDISPAGGSEDMSELEVLVESGPPVLVFKRTFPLLVGRAHVPDREDEEPPLGLRVKRFFGAIGKEPSDEIRPCKKCAKIWQLEEEN